MPDRVFQLAISGDIEGDARVVVGFFPLSFLGEKKASGPECCERNGVKALRNIENGTTLLLFGYRACT